MPEVATGTAGRIKRLQKDIAHSMGKAVDEYELIQDGDKILVAVSGGKDSLCLLHFLQAAQKKAPVKFEILAVNVDQGQPGFPKEVLPQLFSDWQVPYHIETEDTYSIVLNKTPPGKTYCAVCSRLRRGILYRIAREHGCNKIALGHHREDTIETFLLNGFFAGKLSAMPAGYTVHEGDLEVIRPLIKCREEWLADYARLSGWPIIPCNLCGSQSGLKRQAMGELLRDLEKKYPEIKNSLLGALGNIEPGHLLDKNLSSSNAPPNPKDDYSAV